jgi:hypothetical protein
MKNLLRIGLAFLFFAQGAAKAQVRTWTFQNVTFADGGTLSGSFQFDFRSSSYSNINIVTTEGLTNVGHSTGEPFHAYTFTSAGIKFTGHSNVGVQMCYPECNFNPGDHILTIYFSNDAGISGIGLEGASPVPIDHVDSWQSEGLNTRSLITGTVVSLDAFAFLPQVAIGNGWSTLFTVTNTGSTAATGVLSLTDQQGIPLMVNGTLTDSFGTTQPAYAGSSFAFNVPSGGTIFLLTIPVNPNDPTKVGWAEVDSTGGSLSAIATYEYAPGAVTQTMVGVLQLQLLQFATIPVDNNTSQGKQLAYAICNPSRQTISINLALVGQNGTVVDDTVTVTLGPGQQIARYLWQDLQVRSNFKGSLVLRGQYYATFAALGLLDKQEIYTVIPLIAGKAPGVPN